MSDMKRIQHPWAQPMDRVLKELETDSETGLASDEVKKRKNTYGTNTIKQIEKDSTFSIFVRQFKSLIMLVLALAAGLSFAFKQWIDGTGILLALFINAFIGFFTELQAVRSMEALEKMDVKHTTVKRDGSHKSINAEGLVPGDVAVIESGDIVTADIRLIESNRLRVNESALTGESVPVRKQTEPMEKNTPLAERTNMLYKGTAVTEGSGFGIVVATGMDTELGGVASMVQEAEAEADPLTKRLNSLTTQLVRAIIVVAVASGAAGIIAGKELFTMIETSIALFVAAVPEGLPIVATLALARGMGRMAKRNALVRRLSAVQTLGSTNVIFTDKTGTLTENQMTLTNYSFPGGVIRISGTGLSTEGAFYQYKGYEAEGHTAEEDKKSPVDPREVPPLLAGLRVGVLCNNASLSQSGKGERHAVGDPMEAALLVAGKKAGLSRDVLLKDYPEEREIAFDPKLNMMATFHRIKSPSGPDYSSGNNNEKTGKEGGLYQAVKGAPDAVLPRANWVLRADGSREELTEVERNDWLEKNRSLAAEGLRVLALAERVRAPGETIEEATEKATEGARESFTPENAYEDLSFLGLIGLLDPPRKDVGEAIEVCHRAGIRVIMVTGDQQETAVAIGKELGILSKTENGEGRNIFHGRDLEDPGDLSKERRKELLNGAIFCRVSPEQKLHLIDLHQGAGSIVAMTGDGVNDAPALKKADIGVAMGKRGEPVAEDAADILLQDDRFATINAAIEFGRIIFENIRKFVLYMISGNIGEILIVVAASIAGAPLPLLPLQILYINAINDIFPALALGVGPGSGRVMDRPPRDPSSPIMGRRQWAAIGVFGTIIGGAVLAGFALSLTVFDMEVERAVTISFLSIAFARLWHVFNMRDPESRLFSNQVTRNPLVWGALVLCVGLLLLAVYVPPIAGALQVVNPGKLGWLIILGTSLVPLFLGQIGLALTKILPLPRTRHSG